ncbi:MAG: hypothetical protein ACLR8Y_07660 [Alistipes indistinctus]
MRKCCDSLTAYARAATRPVAVGSVVIGGGIRADPVDDQYRHERYRGLCGAGAAHCRGGRQIVRLTAQGRREAANLAAIRARLREEDAPCRWWPISISCRRRPSWRLKM